ncbi:hypothetical protein [uncultured Aquitalea sp.]|uniref:hypothetical protein n=1 Tax=uncultured Aquitalea sp. TaxID=540272 RepID=UPI0025DE9E32|nr:hypothetical protein [uncultured Aquitalea sp.]
MTSIRKLALCALALTSLAFAGAAPKVAPASPVALSLKQDDQQARLLVCPDARGKLALDRELPFGKLQFAGQLSRVPGHEEPLLEFTLTLATNAGAQPLRQSLLLTTQPQLLGTQVVIMGPTPHAEASTPTKKQKPMASAPLGAEKITFRQQGMVMIYAADAAGAACPAPAQ